MMVITDGSIVHRDALLMVNRRSTPLSCLILTYNIAEFHPHCQKPLSSSVISVPANPIALPCGRKYRQRHLA